MAGELLGWERPNWYALPGDNREEHPTWDGPSWFRRSGEEHEAVHSGVQGADATAVLQKVCDNDIDVELGRIAYTQWLNDWAASRT